MAFHLTAGLQQTDGSHPLLFPLVGKPRQIVALIIFPGFDAAVAFFHVLNAWRACAVWGVTAPLGRVCCVSCRAAAKSFVPPRGPFPGYL